MDFSVLAFTIFACIFWTVGNTILTISLHSLWIKKGDLLINFPEWKGTKNPQKWFIAWIVALWGNCIVLICFVLFLFPSVTGVMIGFLGICPAYLLLWGFIYMIVKNILKEKYMKQ